ncbi:type II secretion system F family protein [Homoserinimonas sp. A447]
MNRRRADASVEQENVASLVQRLAVLLAAGVPPPSAWGYLLPENGESDWLRLNEVVRRIRSHGAADEAILAAVGDLPESAGWRGLAAAWRVASEAGAPLAPTLAELAGSLRDLAETDREVQVALAAPVATARMVMALPVVGVLFGLALGFDTLGTLFGTPAGLVCLMLGAGLMLIARFWNRRLVRSAAPTVQSPGLALDLVAIAVSGGASTDRAIQAATSACRGSSIPIGHDQAAIDSVLQLSRRAGVPAAALLRSEAEEARRRARSDGARRAATLSVTLMLPLGLCILPAFMLLGVAPLLIAVISSTVAGF